MKIAFQTENVRKLKKRVLFVMFLSKLSDKSFYVYPDDRFGFITFKET